MKTAKKVLALLLSVLMVFTMVSSSVVAVAETVPAEKTQIEDAENKVTNAFDTVKGIIDGVHNLVGGILSMLGKECVFCDEVHSKAEADDEDTQEPTEPETPPSEPEVPVEPEEPTEPETPVEPEQPEEPEADKPVEDQIGNAFDSIGNIYDSIHNLVGSILAIFGKECPFCDKVHGNDEGETDEPDVPDTPDVPEETTYTVSFDLNYEGVENTIPSQTVKAGGTAVEPDEPERIGYVFSGWFNDKETSTSYDFSNAVTGNIILFALWEEVKSDIVVEDFSASLGAMMCNEEEHVIVKANIISDIDISGFVFKAVCQETNEEIVLFDNGNDCDDIAGDGIFTGSFVAYSENSKTNNYVLFVDGYTGYIKECSFKLMFFSMEDVNNNSKISENITENIDSLVEEFVITDDDEETALNAYNILCKINEFLAKEKETGRIKSYLQDGLHFEIELPIGLYFYDFPIEGTMGTSNNNYVYTEKNTKSIFADEAYTYKIATVQPFEYEDHDCKVLDPAAESIEEKLGYKFLTNQDNTNVTIDFLKTLSDYKVIIWEGHGNYSEEYHSYLASCEFIGDNNDAHIDDRVAGRVVEYQGIAWGVTWKFFDYYYREKNNPFNDSLIYFTACCSAKDSKLADTLINCGAKAVVGYDNYVHPTYGDNICKTFFKTLIEDDDKNSKLTKTAKESLAKAKDKHGEDDGLVFGYIGSLFGLCKKEEDRAKAILKERDKNSFRLREYATDNLSFEKGFIGWDEKTGDCRILEQVGDLKPVHGNRFAFLSTGVGAIDDSISKISRTFKKENGDNTLTFQYNFVSEEPMEYVGSSYDDYFRVYLVNTTTCIEIMRETVNEAEWILLGDNYFNGGDETTYHTGWKTCSIDLSSIPKGQDYKIIFEVGDIGDSAYDSAALIDNIVIS